MAQGSKVWPVLIRLGSDRFIFWRESFHDAVNLAQNTMESVLAEPGDYAIVSSFGGKKNVNVIRHVPHAS